MNYVFESINWTSCLQFTGRNRLRIPIGFAIIWKGNFARKESPKLRANCESNENEVLSENCRVTLAPYLPPQSLPCSTLGLGSELSLPAPGPLRSWVEAKSGAKIARAPSLILGSNCEPF